MSSYSMLVILLPKMICKELETIMEKFLWGENLWFRHSLGIFEAHDITKWYGGQGFRSVKDFNVFMLAKQAYVSRLTPFESVKGQVLS